MSHCVRVIRRTIQVAAWFALCAPLLAQRAEVYGLGGYAHGADNSPANGGFFGGGVGIRAVSIFGVQGEFLQARVEPFHFTTGALNLVLEKRTGRVRPGGIVLGVGGATDNGRGYLFAQAGAGAAVMLTDRLYLRPQLRVQAWAQIFGSDRTCVSAAVALGYRF